MTDEHENRLSAAGHLLASMYGDQIAKSMVNDIAVLKRLTHDEYARKHHTILIPHDPKFLSARQAFYERWQKMTDEGLEYGYLDYAHCYECGGELTKDISTGTPETVYDETEEEFEDRIAALPPRKAFEMFRLGQHIEQHRKALDE